MPANGSLCSSWASLQTRRSAKESGHSLEFNGPLQMREHSLLEIRRRWGLWADSAVDRDFTPLCYTITYMHLHCAEKVYSCSLEFCLGGFYNKQQLVFCPVLFLWPEYACHLSLACVLFCVISLVISNTCLWLSNIVYHAKWNNSEKDRYLCVIIYVCNLKHTDIDYKVVVTTGEGELGGASEE